jgi:hypothetical protein
MRHNHVVASNRRGGSILGLFAALVGVSLSGCAASTASESSVHASPVTALHDAITALQAESRYSLTVTDSTAGLGDTPEVYKPEVYKVDIQRPNRIAITGGMNVIAIGSPGYFKATSYGWTTVHHTGESTNFLNDLSMYIDMLKRATSATRNGDTYTIPPIEAAQLLVTTGQPRFQSATDVSLSAIIAGGRLKSVTLHGGGASPISATTTVAEVGSSPAVEAPPRGRILPAS